MGAFGEKLRKQREQQGIALDAISNSTKISTRMLRALEEEHFDQLPGGVFNKGFVRAYARHVGLNEEEAVADYLAALRESQVQARSILPDFRDHHHDRLEHDRPTNDLPEHDRPEHDLRSNNLPENNGGADRSHPVLKDDPRKPGRHNHDEDDRDQNRRSKELSPAPDFAAHAAAARPRERFRKYPAGSPEQPARDKHNDPSLQIPWGKLAVGLLLVTFALAIWNSRRHRTPAAAPQPAAASAPSFSPAPVATPPARAAQSTSSAAPLKAAKTSLSTAASQSGKLSPGTTSVPKAPSPATSAPGAATAANLSRDNSSLAADTAPVSANSSSTFTLLIRAEKTSWVSITADGKPVAEETLIAPAHTSVRATGEVVVKAGNAAGISFQLNGKEIPAEGNEGEVKTYVFDASGFRVLPQTQSPTVR